MASLAPFSDEERAEYKARPIGGAFELTEEQLAARLATAKRVVEYGNNGGDPDMPDFARAVYKAAPPYAFFVTVLPDGTRLRRRVYGAMNRDDGEMWVHCATAHIGWVGGVPVSELTRIDRWAPEDLAFFRRLPPHERTAFEDPHGFACFG